jgi:hypothetical protein
MTEPSIETLSLYIQNGEGYIALDHAIRTPEELLRDVITVALECGFVLSDEDLEEFENTTESEWLYFVEDEAIQWLNTHHCPDKAWWGHDGVAGVFGCWPITEDDA